jgi:AcrR family transcriptional regulator
MTRTFDNHEGLRSSEGGASRRDRKKQRTRNEIVLAARQLFIDRGYESTTVAAIAERADVAISTFFQHFPTKQHVFFADCDLVWDDLVRSLREYDRDDETVLDVAIRSYQLAFTGEYDREITWTGNVAAVTDTEADRRWLTRRRLLIDADPLLEAMERQLAARALSGLTEAFAHDLNEPSDELRPRLAAETVQTFGHTFARWLSDHPETVVADGIAYFSQGLRAAIEAILALPTYGSSSEPREMLDEYSRTPDAATPD